MSDFSCSQSKRQSFSSHDDVDGVDEGEEEEEDVEDLSFPPSPFVLRFIALVIVSFET